MTRIKEFRDLNCAKWRDVALFYTWLKKGTGYFFGKGDGGMDWNFLTDNGKAGNK